MMKISFVGLIGVLIASAAAGQTPGFPPGTSGGGSGSPGGTSGQIQFNSGGNFGGFTASGDATINTGTGAVAVTQTGGVAFAPSATTDTTNAANIASGTLPAARLPNPSATTLGGTKSLTATTHQFLTSISVAGQPVAAQPASTDVSGLGTSATVNTGTSGATIPLLSGTNTWSAVNTFGSGDLAATSPSFTTPTLGAASATSISFGGSALSTYVTGSWTPGVSFGGAATGITYSAQFGIYSQIGPMVCVNGTIQLTGVGSATGSALITGLPVTIRAGSNPNPTFAISATNLSAATVNIYNSSATGGNTIGLFTLATGVESAMSNSNFTATSFVTISGCYFQ